MKKKKRTWITELAIIITVSATGLMLLTSCADKGLTPEEWGQLSEEEVLELRAINREKYLVSEERKKKRRRFWRTSTPTYMPYTNYNDYQKKQKVYNKILYPNLYK